MKRYISILRGINVGGRRKLLMTDLKQLYNRLGFSNVTTYIQSGNVVFDYSNDPDNSTIENLISDAIRDEFDYDVPVIVRNLDEYRLLFDNNPFISELNPDINHLAITFLKSEPETEHINNFENIDFSPTKFKISGMEIYIYFKGKSMDSKLTHSIIENKLRVKATTRNWKTTTKLFEIATSK